MNAVPRRLAPVLLGLALLAAACSEGATATTTSTAAAATVTTAAAPETTAGSVPGTTVAPTTTAASPDATAVTNTTSATATTTTTIPVAPVPLADLDLTLVPVADGFTQPVFLDAPAGDPRLFVVDQPGTITVFPDGNPAPFLDLTDRVGFGNASEQGLLGLAFHPGYAENGRFFVHYTGRSGETVLQEYAVSQNDPDRAAPEPVRTVLTVPQPAANHNGGMIAFGPDGYLYLALGDGGGADDRFGNGQDRDSLLGAILRLDVDQDPYGIPSDNVFAEGGGAPEIWAYGLRNPWRFSFDGDRVFIADVGQQAREEIDVASSRSIGLNFGWPIYEGGYCFAGPCDPTGLIAPAYEYPHEAGACSVTGGYVYRGAAIPELAGAYFFGDFCSGVITSFRIDGEGIFEIRDWTDTLGTVPGLTSFGTDGFGEIYLTAVGGSVFRIERG